jgi:hypothetical protein
MTATMGALFVAFVLVALPIAGGAFFVKQVVEEAKNKISMQMQRDANGELSRGSTR